MTFLKLAIFCFIVFGYQCFSEECCSSLCQSNLFRDLLTVREIDRCLNDRMPVSYSFYLNGGYFVMPSARMGPGGTFTIGYCDVPPYRSYNLGLQVHDHLEVTGNYRIFCGVDDPVLTPLGFGDFSDKGANLRVALLLPEDSDYKLPGMVIGLEDFVGTRSFAAKYIVLTQVFRQYNAEASIGIGHDRLRGLFGGVLWMPFRRSSNAFVKGISLVAEYDATDYENPAKEKHPDGRVKKSPINYGLKYRLWNTLDFSVAKIRGDEIAWSGALTCNFGSMKSFIPKIGEALPYRAPVNTQPLGVLRSEDVMIQDFLYAMREQGFTLLEGWLSVNECNKKIVRLKVYNNKYAVECDQRDRLTHLVAYLTPSDIDEVIVVIESEGFSVQEYHFCVRHLERYRACKIGEYELAILSPLCEVSCPDPWTDRLLFRQRQPLWNVYARPDYNTIFGSARGKFKYTLGVAAGVDGFLWGDIYYSAEVSYQFFSDIDDVGDVDRLNPSQIVNVRTDLFRYLKENRLILEEMYLQKNCNLGQGWYGRLSGGYYEIAYGGVALELLYYPVWSQLALGMEVAWLKKREYSGLGFTNTVRKLEGFVPTYRSFNPWQAFLDLYYDWNWAQLDVKTSFGRFLAGDKGARLEVGKYFCSGLRLYFWYARTDAGDVLNGKRYDEKGAGFSMPLDMFYTSHSRRRWGYGMSAWLRDVAVRIRTGRGLYRLIHELRQF